MRWAKLIIVLMALWAWTASGETLRAALDAALSSPSGIGVAVDDSGAVIGGVVADQVIDALEDQRRSVD